MVTVPLNVQKAASVNAEVAHILIEIPTPFLAKANETELASSVAKFIPGSRLMAGSLHKTEAPNIFGLFVAASKRTVDMETASAAGMTKVSDSLYTDSDDGVWTVSSDANGAFLVASGSEDIASLLQAVKVRAIATASVAIDLEEHYDTNQPVLYYDATRECASFGVGVGDQRVYNPETLEIAHVLPTAVLAVYEGRTDRPLEFASAPNSGTKAAALAYYTKLYAHNKEMLNKIKAMLNDAVYG